jgi:hypothetical protein
MVLLQSSCCRKIFMRAVAVVHASNSSYVGGVGRRITVWSCSCQKVGDPIWKITKSKKGWRCCSRGIAFAYLSSNASTGEKNICENLLYFFIQKLWSQINAVVKTECGVRHPPVSADSLSLKNVHNIWLHKRMYMWSKSKQRWRLCSAHSLTVQPHCHDRY